jgi:hypothetical protein
MMRVAGPARMSSEMTEATSGDATDPDAVTTTTSSTPARTALAMPDL